jgi:gas vesicle protein
MTTTRDYACFLSGLGAGVAVALLLTPRSGSQIRNEIKQTLAKGRQILRDSTATVVEGLEREKESLEAAIDAGKKAYSQTAGRSSGGSNPAAT